MEDAQFIHRGPSGRCESGRGGSKIHGPGARSSGRTARESAGRGRGGRHHDSPDVQLSKSLSYVLRHGAAKCGLTMRADGYVRMAEILAHERFCRVTEEDVRRVVAENNKQRFALAEESFESHQLPELLIRANQGHTVSVEALELEPIKSPNQLPVALHGTYMKAWASIRKSGLSAMKRNHIHLATGEYGHVTSGVRPNCELYIYIDVPAAMAEGVVFERSANGVILTKGVNGVLPARLFAKAVHLSSGEDLLPLKEDLL